MNKKDVQGPDQQATIRNELTMLGLDKKSKAKVSNSMPNLIEDILEEIFKRLEIKDLLIVSIVCKKWYAMAIKFIYKRLPPEPKYEIRSDLQELYINIAWDLLCNTLEKNSETGKHIRFLEFLNFSFNSQPGDVSAALIVRILKSAPSLKTLV